MDEIELLRLQDEALSYLRDNITKDEAYKDSGFRSMSDVISYANNMTGDKPIDHIRVSNETRGWCGSYTNYGKMID